MIAQESTTPLITQEPEQSPAIVGLLDTLTLAVCGTTRQAAHRRNACLICHKVISPAEFAAWTPAGRAEYGISGVCEPCFDAMFAGVGAAGEEQC